MIQTLQRPLFGCAHGRRELTSSTNVSAGMVDDLSLRACLGCVGPGEESRDESVVQCPVAVVGAVDASSEDSETVDSSKLTPTIAGCILSRARGRESREQ